MTRHSSEPADGLPDPRRGRQRYLVAYLRATVAIVFLLAVAAVVLDDEAGRRVGIAMVTLLALAPIVRVAWLLGRWLHVGDRRYAGVAAGVLAVVLAAVGAGRLG